MPAKPGRSEQIFIKLFVSAYENFAWANSKIEPLDEENDGSPDALITRVDGQTMAIEHTLIQPFVSDKRDFAMFEPEFQKIEADRSLAIANAGIIVYVPVGIRDGRRPEERDMIVKVIHSWIATNRNDLHEGTHKYLCDISGGPAVSLTVKRSNYGRSQGVVLIRRQQMTNDLDKVIEKALRRKLPKLVNTEAGRHLLFLERDQLTFLPDQIFTEIERQRSNFPLLEKVDEIWHVETVCHKQGGHLDFELRKGDQELAAIAFQDGKLVGHSKDGMPYPIGGL